MVVRVETFYLYFILPSFSTIEALPADKKNPPPNMVRYVLELSKSFHIIIKLKYTNELYTDLLNCCIYYYLLITIISPRIYSIWIDMNRTDSTSTKKHKKFGGIFVQIGLIDGGISSFGYCERTFGRQPDLVYHRTVFSFTILRIDLRQWRDNLVRIHSGMAMGLPQ